MSHFLDPADAIRVADLNVARRVVSRPEFTKLGQ
jgi:hypothetical protein